MSLWKNHYKIGVMQIDEQHKQIIGLTEEILKELKKKEKADPAVFRRAVDFLKDYIVVHFSTEEIYMERVGYEGLAAHKALHTDFSERLHELDLKIMRDGYTRKHMCALADMLTRWLIYHIMKEDKKLAPDPEEVKKVVM